MVRLTIWLSVVVDLSEQERSAVIQRYQVLLAQQPTVAAIPSSTGQQQPVIQPSQAPKGPQGGQNTTSASRPKKKGTKRKKVRYFEPKVSQVTQ